MGLMYAWATKEYLLWEMTIGQIIMYNNKGYNIKNNIVEKEEISDKKLQELKKIKEDMKQQYGDIE
jgi:hypothetical protein